MRNYTFIYILFAVALAGCSSMSGTSTQQLALRPVSQQADAQQYRQTADRYLQLAANSEGTDKQNYELDAAGRLILDGMYSRAQQLLDNITSQPLSQAQRNQEFLLQSKLLVSKNKPRTALSYLLRIKTAELSVNQRNEYHELLAIVYEKTGAPLSSAKQYIQLEKALADPIALQNTRRQIWHRLQELSINEINNALTTTKSEELKGWLQLLALVKQNADDTQKMLQVLQQWQVKYPTHPGNNMMHYSLSTSNHIITSEPTHIALLLPLQGKLAGPGKAVRDGFMAAYYQALQLKKTDAKIKLYDTSQQSIYEIYQKAISDGADFVVGPLNKPNVQAISYGGRVLVPTLALNYTNSRTNYPGFYQFGISPQDEAQQVALKAYDHGMQHAIVLAPAGEWGQGIANSFVQQWNALGGTVIANVAFTKTDNMSVILKGLLSLDQSNARANSFKRLVRDKVKFIPRRRKDVDMIFLAALPSKARAIKPLLRFYYAGHIPVYSTSLVYAGTPSRRRDKDLNGIIFSDMPWVFENGGKLQLEHASIQRLWPEQLNRYTRLYALGLDAFKLASQINRLALFPELGIQGATGTLFLDQQHRVTRKVKWAKFRGGVPRLLRS